MAQLALLSLALPSKRPERPSTSRRFTSLPSVAPTMRPLDATTTTTSGSGLFQVEIAFRPASMPCPTDDRTCDFVKISASGPMPTSRYCDQTPFSIRTCFSFMACGEPGLSFDRSSPISSPMLLRISAAASGLPRARSSITRSSMEVAKVTPAAFTHCRSMGGSSQGCAAFRVSGAVLASMAARPPRISPSAARADPAGSSVSQRSRMVGKLAVMSRTRSPSTRTTLGPSSPGFQTRPTSRPDCGRQVSRVRWSASLGMIRTSCCCRSWAEAPAQKIPTRGSPRTAGEWPRPRPWRDR